MPKKKIDYDKAAKMLFSRTEHYADNVRRLYAAATDELLKLSAMKAPNGVSAVFSFSDSKRLSEQANAILRALYSGVYNEIKGGVIAEWENANKSCDALITSIFGKKVKENNHYARYFARNKESVDAFFKRKSEYGGLNLSQRVWKYVGDFKTEMEMALSVAMGEGKSAATISREVRKYLQRPDMMFRRFRVKTGEQDIFDADGNVVGKEPVYGRVWKRKVVDAVTGNVSWQTVNLKDYSFGRGVYRSSYKNAMRLARTETNMAYRTADQERWRQLDFVIGYRVVLSDNHPEPDICNDLSAKRGEKGSRGVYPKDFVFKGWHPQCRCYVVPILADDKEFEKIQEAILNDEPIPESKSVIREPNKYFQDWWKSNKKRVAEAQSLPYWVKDNSRMLGINQVQEKGLYKGIKLGRAASKSAKETILSHQERHDYSEEQQLNFKDIEQRTGWKRGKPMSFEEADGGKSNVFRDDENCAACVLVHELRLRGFDVTSLAYDHKSGSVSMLLSNDTRQAWLTSKGKKPEFTALIGGSEKEIVSKIEKQTQVVGSRYHIGWDNKLGGGHIITIERTKNGLVFYDPQRNDFLSIGEIVNDIMMGSKIELLRVDKLLVNPSLLDSIASAINI